ncbi:MAG: sodium/proton-translocating pyrophosphatase, partial [Candidatus Kuenenia sp.]|nr:sodium/proton-translocating pyrophosphatase [Candidatus Kuenenia sp.]
FAIGSAALTAMALIASFVEQVKLGLERAGTHVIQVAGINIDIAKATLGDLMASMNITLINPMVLVGLFMGGLISFVFCALTMKAVGRAAGSMVEEVRRQFREIPGIMEGTNPPDYAACVSISTKGAQREMILPSVLALLTPIATGLILGVPGVVGLLAGSLTTGFLLAVFMANAGGAWDNAKKYIESGAFGGKGSDAHKAAVVGDTVGDPFKDTSGPSLNILLKLMSVVSVVFAGITLKYSEQISAFLHLN